jgi:hypothetical protein
MNNNDLLNNCISGGSEIACVSRIDSMLSWPDLMLYACMLFMFIAAIGSVIELSAKRIGVSGLLKFGVACFFSAYLVFIPLCAYSLSVFKASDETVSAFRDASWFHHLQTLSRKHIS